MIKQIREANINGQDNFFPAADGRRGFSDSNRRGLAAVPRQRKVQAQTNRRQKPASILGTLPLRTGLAVHRQMLETIFFFFRRVRRHNDDAGSLPVPALRHRKNKLGKKGKHTNHLIPSRSAASVHQRLRNMTLERIKRVKFIYNGI